MTKIHTFEWMSLKLIIWIIIGIVYLISRSRKKQEEPAQPSSEHEEVSSPTKPVSFEELLREIQSAKTTKQAPRPVAQYTDYDEDIEEEEKGLEKTDYSFRDQDKTYEAYEKAKQEAFHRPSMEETLKLENTVVRFGQFKGYQQEEKPALAAEFAEDLKNPANFRKAFILSEILNRKF
jgi:hypothetical protein